jgi:hypothetical protein
MKRLPRTVLFCLLFSPLPELIGCATRGGWPTWAWEKNTDQKEESQAQQYLKTNTIAPGYTERMKDYPP